MNSSELMIYFVFFVAVHDTSSNYLLLFIALLYGYFMILHFIYISLISYTRTTSK